MVTKQCSKCKKVYPNTPENFPYKRGQCRSCRRACQRKYHKEHREQLAANQRRYCAKHREQIAAREKKYREEHREQRAAQQKPYQKEYRRKLRLEVLNHYTPKGLRCACCGEDHVEFLCIDHINGGGGQHRKSINGDFYNWLKKHGFPKGFRVLCFNCNGSLGFYGYCPHKA